MLRARNLRRMIDAAKRDRDIENPREYIKDQIQFQLSEGLKASDYSIRDLFVQLVPDGRTHLNNWEQAADRGEQIVESATAVTTADFALIAEQLLFSEVMEAYNLASLVGDKLATVFPSRFQESEVIPGISVTSDEYDTPIPENKPYPEIGMQPATVRLPAAEKRGGILKISREAIIRDNTGLLIQRAQTVGEGFGLNKEKRILDTVTGADASYVRKEVARPTYETSAAGTFMGFTNENDHPLVDLSDIREMDETFNQVSDPDINEPLLIEPTTLLCGRDLSWQARNIIRATEVREGDITAAATPQTMHTGNRLPFNLDIVRSEHLTRRIIARNGEGGLVAANRAAALPYWWFGNFKKAFLYKEIWAMTTEQAPANNMAQFESDVWYQIKVSEKGVACVREPRVVIRSDGT
jgi:hypothetical protein